MLAPINRESERAWCPERHGSSAGTITASSTTLRARAELLYIEPGMPGRLYSPYSPPGMYREVVLQGSYVPWHKNSRSLWPPQLPKTDFSSTPLSRQAALDNEEEVGLPLLAGKLEPISKVASFLLI